jgi:ankyrin repeat protein
MSAAAASSAAAAERTELDTALMTALHEAAEEGRHKEIRELCAEGANVDAMDELNYTPAWLAAVKGHAGCLRVLQELGADLNICCWNGMSPLCAAANSGREECVRILHALGADLNKGDQIDVSPISMAIFRNKPATVRMLVRLGADVQPLLDYDNPKPAIAAIAKEVRDFLKATGLVRAGEHQLALHSVVQLVLSAPMTQKMWKYTYPVGCPVIVSSR